jgi:hypothetical protein
MVVWITGADILLHAGVTAGGASAPSDEDVAWADACAAAVSAGFDHRLTGATVTGDEPELVWAARGCGVEAYKRREAVFGLTGYVDLQGAAIRVARDYLEAVAPTIARYATFGLA